MKNKKAQYTPGPWKVETVHDGEGWKFQIQGSICPTSAVIVADGPLSFEKIPQGPHSTYDAQMDNARLIAAAPEMLEALKVAAESGQELRDGKRGGGTMGRASGALDVILAAIAKAEGL